MVRFSPVGSVGARQAPPALSTPPSPSAQIGFREESYFCADIEGFELIDAFGISPDMPSASAFIQQRNKVKAEAFKAVFDGFTSNLINEKSDILRILAVDGSDVQIATNPDDLSSYYPGTNGQKTYNLLQINALLDLKHNAVIQGRMDWDEHNALQEMIDRSNIRKALVIADRGYELYNNMAHIQEKGWYFLIRIKDGKTGIMPIRKFYLK